MFRPDLGDGAGHVYRKLCENENRAAFRRPCYTAIDVNVSGGGSHAFDFVTVVEVHGPLVVPRAVND